MTLQILERPSAPSPVTVAGALFPANPEHLAHALTQLEQAAAPGYCRPWSAIVAPHAGYRFSGAVAASIYRTTDLIRERCKRIVLLSPAHRLGFNGMAVLDGTSIATPLGAIALDGVAHRRALAMPEVRILPAAFDREHGIETQLPFIKKYLPHAALLPIVVGHCPDAAIANVMRAFAGEPGTLIVVSTDLSHYHELDEARRIDAETCSLIEHLAPDRLTSKNACGVLALRALLSIASVSDWRVTRLDARTSAEAGGDPHRVVGYAAYGMEPACGAELPGKHRATLLALARKSVQFAVSRRTVPNVRREIIAHTLATQRRVFVTLTRNGQLRGCKGSLAPDLPLAQGVVTFAAHSAISDTRFKPVEASEIDALEIEISILSEEAPIASATREDLIAALRPGIDGLTLRAGNRRATFLPKVWASIPEPAQFVASLLHKAGLPPEAWPHGLHCTRYSAECFGDKRD